MSIPAAYQLALDTRYNSDALAGYYRTRTPLSFIVALTGVKAISGSTYPLLQFATPYSMPAGTGRTP